MESGQSTVQRSTFSARSSKGRLARASYVGIAPVGIVVRGRLKAGQRYVRMMDVNGK